MREFISVEAARACVLAAVPRQAAAPVPLAEALGHTLAAPLRSRDAIPPFDNSAMDGYAVRAEDLATLPATLRIIEDLPAGTAPTRTVVPGTCARIMTGAPLPAGADAVAPVEWSEADDDATVRLLRAPTPGQHVRRAGEDVQVGEEVIEAGRVVTPPVIGMAATLGYGALAVAVPPRVAVIATGDELVEAAEALGPGQIRNANGPALVAQVRSAGGAPLPRFHARDTADAVRAVIEAAFAEADVLLFSGGVSVGRYDYVKTVLDEKGMELLFWKVRQRPGKPLAFGLLGGKPVFGLPGNPVSSAVCFEQYVRPALAHMLGRREVLRPRFPAVLTAPTAKAKGLHHFTRGLATPDATGRLGVRDTGAQGSNLYSSMVRANCFIHLPPDLDAAPAGTLVEIEWLTW